MITELKECRICGNKTLKTVIDLGNQALTGVFPEKLNKEITTGPLKLVKCYGEECCGLLQLSHSYDTGEMYGNNYGYRSGLNKSMVDHLRVKVDKILKVINLKNGDLVIDIGSNDSTTLQAYPENGVTLVGIDPTGAKFKNYYPEYIELIPDFFSASKFRNKFGNRKAKVITSFSMFYDLEAPLLFMKDVYDILSEDGIWVFEQSYMPTMLEKNSYDTICHEHLEYYSLEQIKWMTEKVGFNILSVEFNEINGGSFSIMAGKKSAYKREGKEVRQILEREKKLGLRLLDPYFEFEKRILKSKKDLVDFILKAKNEGKSVAALGASTKGNVILQYCGLTNKYIACIGEINEEKLGCYTPGSGILIISETDAIKSKFDYLIILPWHFRNHFLNNAIFEGSSLVFPLPELEIIEL